VTSFAYLRAFGNAAGRPLAMLADRQEYLPRLWHFAAAGSGTDANVVASSADCPRSEMVFERLAPSCYLSQPFSILLEQRASASQDLDELPAEDMLRAVLDISEVYAEICETAERIVASSPRELDHGKKAQVKNTQVKKAQVKKADGKRADGMSAGG
jgi:hypothetical protein